MPAPSYLNLLHANVHIYGETVALRNLTNVPWGLEVIGDSPVAGGKGRAFSSIRSLAVSASDWHGVKSIGVNLSAGEIAIGGDNVGRDHITRNEIHIHLLSLFWK